MRQVLRCRQREPRRDDALDHGILRQVKEQRRPSEEAAYVLGQQVVDVRERAELALLAAVETLLEPEVVELTGWGSTAGPRTGTATSTTC